MKSVAALVAVGILLFAAVGLGQESLTNESVIKMHQAGLPASVIIAKIQSSETDFDTTVDTLVALAELGLHEDVIAAMTTAGEQAQPGPSQGMVGPTGSVTVGTYATAQPRHETDFRKSLCPDPGIFLKAEDGSLREIEPSTYSGAKSAGMWKSSLTYGIASSKSKSFLQGLTSHNKVEKRSPTFYFCFEEAETGLSYETSGATTPSQFLLVELDVKPSQKARLLVTGKFNAYTGGYAGPPPKYRRDFNYEKVASGVYEVSAASLESGEYAFFFNGSSSAIGAMSFGLVNASGGGKVFDFCIE